MATPQPTPSEFPIPMFVEDIDSPTAPPNPIQLRTLEDVEDEMNESTNLMVEHLAHMIIHLKKAVILRNEYVALSKFEIARLTSEVEEYKKREAEKRGDSV
jgi:hypothetical protein